MAQCLPVDKYIFFSEVGTYGEYPETGSVTETTGYSTVEQTVKSMIQFGNFNLPKLQKVDCDGCDTVGFEQKIRQFTDIADLPKMKALIDAERKKVKPTEPISRGILPKNEVTSNEKGSPVNGAGRQS